MTKRELVVMAVALTETIKESGPGGAPGGILFMGVLNHHPNMTGSEFEDLMAVVCQVTGIRKEGDCYVA